MCSYFDNTVQYLSFDYSAHPQKKLSLVRRILIKNTSGFWPRVRARALRAPVFLGSLLCQTGRCAPPPASQDFTLGPSWAAMVVYLSIGLSCTLLS